MKGSIFRVLVHVFALAAVLGSGTAKAAIYTWSSSDGPWDASGYRIGLLAQIHSGMPPTVR